MPKFTAAERNQIQSIVATLSIKRIPDNEIIAEIDNKFKKSICPRELRNVRRRIRKDSANWYSNLVKESFEYLHQFKERINEIYWLQQKHYEIYEKYKDKNPSIVQNSLSQLHKLNATLAGYFDLAPDVFGLYNGTISNAIREDVSSREQKEQEEAEAEEFKLPRAIGYIGPDDKVHYQDDPYWKQFSRDWLIERFTGQKREKGQPAAESAEGETGENINTRPIEKNITENETDTLVCYCDEGDIMCHYQCPTCHHLWCPEDKAAKQLLCPKCVPVPVE